MSGRNFVVLAAGAVLVAAACSSGAGTPSSPASSLARSSVPAFASQGAATATPAESVCAGTTDPGAIAVEIKDFEFAPANISARTGQVIAFTNTGFEHHNATLDAGGCATRSLATDDRDGLVFATTGRYPFHCTVHPWMTGTIAIVG